MLDVLADMLAEIEADNFFETVGDVKGKALVETRFLTRYQWC